MITSTPLSANRWRVQQPSAEVASPTVAHAPDWSPATLALFAALSPLERRFTEFYAAGYSGAEAYRRASGRRRSQLNGARQGAYKLRSRPRVAVAIQAALGDRNVGARCDREWILGHLRTIVEQAIASGSPAACNAALVAIKTMAKIQGELGQRVTAPKAYPTPQSGVDIRRQIDELVAVVKRTNPVSECAFVRAAAPCVDVDPVRSSAQSSEVAPAATEESADVDAGELTAKRGGHVPCVRPAQGRRLGGRQGPKPNFEESIEWVSRLGGNDYDGTGSAYKSRSFMGL